MAMTDFTIIRRSMTSRLFSTIVTALMVAVSVAMLLVLLSMRESGQRAFSQGKGNMHMLVSADDSALTAVLNGVFFARPPRRFLEWSDYESIAINPRLPAYRKIAWAIPTQLGDSYRGWPVLATSMQYFEDYQPVVGRPWAFQDGRAFNGSFEVVVGAEAARSEGLAIGDELYLTHGASDGTGHVHDDFTYRVVGVLEPTGGPQDRALFTDLTSTWIIHAQDRIDFENPNSNIHVDEDDLTLEDRKITGVLVRVATREGSEVSSSQQEVFNAFRADPYLSQRGAVVADPTSEITNLFRIVSNVDQILVAMAVIVLVSSGIAIMLALYNSMEQRRRQIAILRILGCSQGKVFGLIITESAMLGFLGAVIGIFLAIIGGQIVAGVMEQRLGLLIEPRLSMELLLGVVVGTILLASIAGIVPAVMAYRTAVVRNLRPLG